jgi:hypothetical protein
MTVLGKSPRPIMCTAASLNADQTRIQLCNCLHQLRASHLSAQHDFSRQIHAMQLE